MEKLTKIGSNPIENHIDIIRKLKIHEYLS